MYSSEAPTAADPRMEHYSTTEEGSPERFYHQMYLIRRVEQSMLDLFAQGLMSGTVHTSLGQEACAVGVVNALDRRKDVIFSNHRAHGHFIAYCDQVEELVAEIMGRSAGVCGGIGGTQHLYFRNMYTNGIQGGIVPCAVGAALAEKVKGSGAIVVVFVGDGTMGQGTVYEGMNVASLNGLPLLFVLEDNKFAQSTPKELEHAGDLATRSETFGIPSTTVDASDVTAVYEAASAAAAQVRENSHPFFLVLDTYRLGPHSKGDDIRTKEEIDAHRHRDPVTNLAARIDDDVRQQIEARANERAEAAVALAMESAPQTFEEFSARVGHSRLAQGRVTLSGKLPGEQERVG